MAADKQFAVCVDNTDYTAALEVRKIYQVLPDPVAASRSYVRIIDESGEDYLYPKSMFLQVKVRPEARATLVRIVSFSRGRNSKNSSKVGRRSPTPHGNKVKRTGAPKRFKAVPTK
jgi:hypothetical protein